MPRLPVALRLAHGPVPHSALDAPWPLTVLPGAADGWLGHARRMPGTAPAGRRRRAAGTTSTARGTAASRVTCARAADGLTPALTGTPRRRTASCAVDAVGAPTRPTTPHRLDVAALRVRAAAAVAAPTRCSTSPAAGAASAPRSAAASTDGTHLRARAGAAAPATTRPCCSSPGTPGFGFRSGEVWAVHVAWSGNHEHLVERCPRAPARTPRCSAAASCSRPGEVAPRPRARPTPRPTVVFVHSADGPRRALAPAAPQPAGPRRRTRRGPRPVVLNTWEAVYFDHRPRPAAARSPTRPPRSASSASSSTTAGSAAAATTAPGSATGRLDRTSGPTAWARSSTTSRASAWSSGSGSSPRWSTPTPTSCGQHPDWVLRPGARAARASGATSRCSTSPTPRRAAHLLEADQRPGRRPTASTSSSGTTTATCIEAVRTRCVRHGPPGRARPDRSRSTGCSTSSAPRHPELEIESCASGGARVDLGVLARTDRIWTSDCNDALERAPDPALDRAAACRRS